MTDEQLLEALEILISRYVPGTQSHAVLRRIKDDTLYHINVTNGTKKQQAIHCAETLIELLKS